MIRTIDDFAPAGTEAGVGLALLDGQDRYLFFLAGLKHGCPPGELFYAGIGGHLEPGEDWLGCAHREAVEELGSDVEILSAASTLHIDREGKVRPLSLADRPAPLALYEMVHPSGTRRAGQIYRIVIYRARLHEPPRRLAPDELQGVLALRRKQVVQGLERRCTLAELLAEGGALVAGGETVDPGTRLFPIGTAHALAVVLQRLDQVPEAGC